MYGRVGGYMDAANKVRYECHRHVNMREHVHVHVHSDSGMCGGR